MPDFAIIDVSSWEVSNPETIGREEKMWLRRPGAPPHSREQDWLFKPVVVPQHGHPQGGGLGEEDRLRTGWALRGPVRGRGRAHRFEHDPSLPRSSIPSLVATAREALSRAGRRAAVHWLGRLAAVDRELLDDS